MYSRPPTFLRRSLSYLARESFIIALGAATISASCSILISGAFNPLLFIFIFSLFFGLYRTNKILDLDEDSINQPESSLHIRKFYPSVWFSVFVFYILAISI